MAGFWENLVGAFNVKNTRGGTAQAYTNSRVLADRQAASGSSKSGTPTARQNAASTARYARTGYAMPDLSGSSRNNRPTPYTLEELMMRGYSLIEALGLLSSGGSGGGGGYGGGGYGGGGGGGGGGYIDTAARDLAMSNIAATYANAEAGLKVSDDVYRKISSEERDATTQATAAANAGAQQSYDDAVAKRALERRALGIEDAAHVGTDAVVTEKKIADDNAKRTDDRMATRAQGHLDNNLKFNTDLRAVVNLEGKERQKDIADYYAGQLAQIAARRSGGGGGGGYRGGGGGRSGGSRGMTPNQISSFLNTFGKNAYNEQTNQFEARYGLEDRQAIYKKAGNDLPYAKYLAGKSGSLYGGRL